MPRRDQKPVALNPPYDQHTATQPHKTTTIGPLRTPPTSTRWQEGRASRGPSKASPLEHQEASKTTPRYLRASGGPSRRPYQDCTRLPQSLFLTEVPHKQPKMHNSPTSSPTRRTRTRSPSDGQLLGDLAHTRTDSQCTPSPLGPHQHEASKDAHSHRPLPSRPSLPS